MTHTCEKCGATLHVGDYPFCPHGTPRLRVKQDTILGGFWAENAWREPRYFESQKAYERALDSSGLMLKERAPTHGRTLDPYTLANAQALVSRTASPATLETLALNTRVLESTVRIQADQT